MKASYVRTITSGLIGGLVFWVTTFLTFVLLGSGLDQASGPLVDPGIQSAKYLAVYRDLQPLPLFATAPHLILAGYVLFGIAYAFVFRSVQRAWPDSYLARTWRLALIVWTLSSLFFEVLGPMNLLGEPVALVGLELAFWLAAAIAEATVIVGLLTVRAPSRASVR